MALHFTEVKAGTAWVDDGWNGEIANVLVIKEDYESTKTSPEIMTTLL